ncbi:MAG: SGNH/GDSL hydrolase family protein [Deltaproteobacteria bacterium]|nr:SGNH/GDSL hydrolase family protein [Deltaproteobacteria bacterium]
MKPLSLRRNIAFSFVLLCLSAFIAFILSEVLLRAFYPQSTGPVMFAFDPRLGQIPVPSQKGRRRLPGVYEYDFENDSSGMRKTASASGSGTRLRALFLGDSFTYGIGVEDSQTFASLTGQGLSATVKPIAAYNAGNPGSGTDYAVQFLRVRGKTLHPDVIVIAFFPNDFDDNQGMRYFQSITADRLVPANLAETFAFFRKKSGLIESPLYNWLSSHSHAVNLLKRLAAWSSLAGGLGNFAEFVQSRADAAHIEKGFATEQGVALTATLMSWADKEARRLGSDLVFAYIPTSVEVGRFRRTRKSGDDERAFESAYGGIHGLRISFTRALADSRLPPEHLYFAEGHWTAEAHRIAARVLTQELALLLKRRVGDQKGL